MEKTLDFPYLRNCNKSQAAFHASRAPYRGFAGGYGAGKTTALIHDVWMNIYRYPGCTALVGRKTYRELLDTTWRMSLDLIPPELIKKISKEHMTITLNTGQDILFRSMEDPHKLRSLNLGFFALDEAFEIDEEYWEMLTTRLRQQNAPRKGILATNYNGHDWIWRKFKRTDNPERYFLVEASTFENAKNLPADYLDKLKDLPESVYKRNVEGTFDDFEGQVFGEFDERIHVCQFNLNPTWEYKRSIDPGLNHPTVCLWYGTDKEGTVYVFDEYVRSDVSAEGNAQMILTKTDQHLIGDHEGISPIKVRWTVIDSSALQRQSTSMKSVFMEYAMSGLKPLIPAARDSRRVGMMRISEFMKCRPHLKHPFHGVAPAPKLFIHERCKNLREQIINFTWEDYEKKRKDDCIDALKYALVMEHHPAISQFRGEVPQYAPADLTTGY